MVLAVADRVTLGSRAEDELVLAVAVRVTLGSRAEDGLVLAVADRAAFLGGGKVGGGEESQDRLRLDLETFGTGGAVAGTDVWVDDPTFVGVPEISPDTSEATRSRRVV